MSVTKFVVITAAKDEAKYLGQTIESVIAQTILPCQWVIVDDGSVDATAAIAEAAARVHPWIKVVRRRDGGLRDVGAGQAGAIHHGIRQADIDDYEVLFNIDADIVLEPKYFQEILSKFAETPQLGIACGQLYEYKNGRLIQFNALPLGMIGAMQGWRRKCFEEIGGLAMGPGWDPIATFKAMMLGWQTRSFAELKVIHLRPIGSSCKNIYVRWARCGQALHFAGAHPVWVLASAFYHSLDRPFVLSGLCRIIGYLVAAWEGLEQYGDQDFRRFLRKWQIKKLASSSGAGVNTRNIKIVLARAASWITWQLANKQGHIGNRIPVLIYHRVLPEYLEDSNPIYTILPEQFESQMAFLKEAGFESLSLQEYTEIARGLRQAAERSVLITFDDGYADNYRIAWPIAAKYDIKINLFICPQLVGSANPIVMIQDGYVTPANFAWSEEAGERVQAHIKKFPQLWKPLTWEELAEMKGYGVNLGFHSHSHRNLALLPLEEIATDITTGSAIFEKHLGYRPQFFAYPYGGYDAYNSQVTATLERLGLNFIFAAHLGRAKLPSAKTVFPRILIYQEDNLAVFQRKIFGQYDWLGQIQGLEHLTRVAAKKISSVLMPLR
jgi:biofilm PGA synthesis N-glycosyltransferase PgaC